MELAPSGDILRRGALLAETLQKRLVSQFQLDKIPLLNLQIKHFSDSLTLLHPETDLTKNPELAVLNLADTSVFLVDDVMCRGHFMLRVVEYLARKQAAEIRTATLVDCDH